MNKYFIGFELPEDYRLRLVKAQEYVRASLAPTTRVLEPSQFHVTSLFLGKCPRSAAEDICNHLAWGFGGIRFRFDKVDVFKNAKGPHALVVKLHDVYGNAEVMNRALREAASTHSDIGLGKCWSYNPHITLAKSEGAPDKALVTAMDTINEKMEHNVTRHEFFCDHLVLFEKCEGMTGYEPHRMLQLR